MNYLRVVVLGALGAGKSTFVNTCAGNAVEPVSRPHLSDPEQPVMMDYGEMQPADDLTIHLFGAPGQRRFDFMWEIQVTGTNGYVLLVDSTRPETFAETRIILEHFSRYVPPQEFSYVVAANKQDQPGALSPDQIHELLALPDGVHVLPCIASDYQAASEIVLDLLLCALARLDEQPFPAPRQIPVALSEEIQRVVLHQDPGLTITRAIPEDCEAVATYLRQHAQLDIDAQQVFLDFGNQACLIAQEGQEITGLAGFYIENLIGRVLLILNQNHWETGVALLSVVHELAQYLEADIIFAPQFDGLEAVFERAGYTRVSVTDDLAEHPPIWQAAYQEDDADEIMFFPFRKRARRNPL